MPSDRFWSTSPYPVLIGTLFAEKLLSPHLPILRQKLRHEIHLRPMSRGVCRGCLQKRSPAWRTTGAPFEKTRLNWQRPQTFRPRITGFSCQLQGETQPLDQYPTRLMKLSLLHVFLFSDSLLPFVDSMSYLFILYKCLIWRLKIIHVSSPKKNIGPIPHWQIQQNPN